MNSDNHVTVNPLALETEGSVELVPEHIMRRMLSYEETYNDSAIAQALRDADLEQESARQGAIALTAAQDRELARALQAEEKRQHFEQAERRHTPSRERAWACMRWTLAVPHGAGPPAPPPHPPPRSRAASQPPPKPPKSPSLPEQVIKLPEQVIKPVIRPFKKGFAMTIGKVVPIIPRINSGILPAADVVTADRQRLLCRLDMYGLVERAVTGDGNCQVGVSLVCPR